MAKYDNYRHFINDDEKMFDFIFTQSKSDFLRSYDYLTEQEYDDTKVINDEIMKYIMTDKTRAEQIINENNLHNKAYEFLLGLDEKDCYIFDKDDYDFVTWFMDDVNLWENDFWLAQLNGVTDLFYDTEQQKYYTVVKGLDVLQDCAWGYEEEKRLYAIRDKVVNK